MDRILEKDPMPRESTDKSSNKVSTANLGFELRICTVERDDLFPMLSRDHLSRRSAAKPDSKDLVGMVGLVRNPPAGAIFDNNLMRISMPTVVSQRLLALQIVSHEFRQQMELVKKAMTSVAAVYSKDLLALAIALPLLAELTRIVAEVKRWLSVVEELELVVTSNLQRASRMCQSILRKALTGER